ncbi:hypothetical protein EV426DRAFT_352251 [Tirmania nivea]|nr:hypothetical protein EV426DRAFT_352251 [Tirmania nivea]
MLDFIFFFWGGILVGSEAVRKVRNDTERVEEALFNLLRLPVNNCTLRTQTYRTADKKIVQLRRCVCKIHAVTASYDTQCPGNANVKSGLESKLGETQRTSRIANTLRCSEQFPSP